MRTSGLSSTASISESRMANSEWKTSSLYSLLAIRHSPRASAGRFQLRDRLRQQLVHVAVDLVVRLHHALGVEILAQLREHAAALKGGNHDLARISVGVGAFESELFRRPCSEHAVAPRGRLELELLVVRELPLEAFLALVEGGHGGPRRTGDGLAYPWKVAKSTAAPRYGRRHCAPHPDRLGFRRGRTAPCSASRAAPAAADRVSTGATASMDFLKPRYTPMSRRRRIYEGKAKVLYEGPEPGTLIQHFKDDATAFNAKKHEVIEGKGVLNNRICEYLFQHLNNIGVATHFIKRLNMREQLIREVEIIPLEVVVRNVAAGSLSQRLGMEEGTQLPRSIIEFYYKNDQLGDPMVSEEHITAFGWATPQEIDDVMALAIRVNDFLSGLFLGVGIRLVDFKMETGRLWENDLMRIVVADEISPDSCRLWDIKSSEKLDKDRFRRDLGGLLEAYTEVAKRLGIMSEGERAQGSGPMLVKG